MATTINAYSVALNLDASSYIRNSSLSRKETASLTRSINQARTPADKYKRQLDLLDKSLAAGAIEQRTYNKLVGDADRRFKAAESAASRYNSALKSQVGTVGKLAAGYVTFSAAFGQLKAGLADSAAAESTNVQFEVLIGNAQRASDLMQQLRQFSAATPFQFGDIAKAGRQLLAFGFESQAVVNNVRILGNIAAGTGNNISELAELVGKARVQGRLFNEDINQLTGRGINVIDGLAKKFGNVKDAAADGRIEFKDLQDVLRELATDGGKFAGMMERMSETTEGKISTLTDNFKQLRMELTEGFLPALNSAIGLLGKVGQGLSTTFGSAAYNRILGFEQERMRAVDEDMRFRRNQIRNRDAIRAGRALGLGDGTAANAYGGLEGLGSQAVDAAKGVASGILSGLSGAASQLSIAAQSQLNVHQNQIAAIQRREQLERDKVTKPDPAVKSLEVGTQEAYKFLTQEQTAANQLAKRQEERRKADAAKAQEAAEKMVEFLGRISDWAENNGFQPIR